MFSKDRRLSKDKEFELVFKTGRSSYDKILGVKMIKNDLLINRYGIIVNNKVSKKAVERNKIKRQIRAILAQQSISENPGHDLIIIVLPGIMEKSFSEIKTSILTQLKRLKLI